MTNEEFLLDIKNHKMKVLSDTDEITSLRFSAGEEWNLWFSVTIIRKTGENYAKTMFSGDAGDFVFNRDFFKLDLKSDYIFLQELTTKNGTEFEFNHFDFVKFISSYDVENKDEVSDFIKELWDLENEHEYYELVQSAKALIDSLEYEDVPSFLKPTAGFLWACHALRHAQKIYLESKGRE